jgi:hypothetical protein
VQIPEDSERPEGTSDSVPEPGREGDQAHHPGPARPRPATSAAPCSGAGGRTSCPGLLVSVAGTDAPGQALVMVEE